MEDRVYGEQSAMHGQMQFPEFMFRPSRLTHHVSLHCQPPHAAPAAPAYVVLQACRLRPRPAAPAYAVLQAVVLLGRIAVTHGANCRAVECDNARCYRCSAVCMRVC